MLEQLQVSDPISEIAGLQSAFLRSKPADERKALGQYFTSANVSTYMASLLNSTGSRSVSILDAGAGNGMLTVSAALRLLELGATKVHAVLYELDSSVASYLRETMTIAQATFADRGAKFTYEVRLEDFVLSRPDRAQGKELFDVAVINPPYFKYHVKISKYAKAVSDLYRGDPNIYASFMAIVMACLLPGGQMVSITPRSFTNGLYFKGFRLYLLDVASLEKLHIFKHRGKVFKNKDSAVLQENIISKFVKGACFGEVVVRSSDCDGSISNAYEETYPVDLIVDPSNDQKLIRIPESADEARILRQAECLPCTFSEAGYFVSTGPVVEHRTRNYITADIHHHESAVPLYRPHNITPLIGCWSGKHKKDVVFCLNEGFEKHLLENDTYVLIKRFSSKDERRRLVSAVQLKESVACKYIGFGNKTNYVGVRTGELRKEEALGLAAVFNSSFMDRYFRTISGNTQVNATEVRVMRFPSRDQILEIGKVINGLESPDEALIDSIVNPILEI
jgi:adenine-specific DNA-methyltransferase